MYEMIDSSIVSRALVYAVRAHQNQRRKGTDIPYIVHPVGAALSLASVGAGADVVAAGLLHDTVEDTGVTLADLRADFGPRVAAIVEACSESDKSWPWLRRKQHTIDRLRTAPLEVKLVAAADKLDNLRAIRADWAAIGDAVWERFKQGKELQSWYYREVSASLNAGSHGLAEHPMGRALAAEVAEFFGNA